MTNRERMMRTFRKPENSNHDAETENPWRGEELKHFWALARSRGLDKEGVYDMVRAHCNGKEHLHELSRAEWLTVLWAISTDGDHHGFANAGQWDRIRRLQQQLGWSDAHRDNYIKKLGHIDSVRFLTVPIARAAIIGLQKIVMIEARKR